VAFCRDGTKVGRRPNHANDRPRIPLERGAVDIPELIGTYGYPLVILGAIAEGETVVIAAGYVAHRQHLSVLGVVACAALGGSLGDLGYFLLGRRYGERALLRLPRSLRAGTARAREAVHRNPVRVLLSMRFLYGLRIALPLLCGASSMSARRFAAYNVATAIAWSACFTAIGYAFGAAATAALRQIERYEWGLLAAAVVLGLVVHLLLKRLRPWIEPAGGVEPDAAHHAPSPTNEPRGHR
jgi:membrane protein DedA with SNARE-associated domain